MVDLFSKYSKGKSRADVNPRSRLGKLFRKEGVPDTPELRRIADLPEYLWTEDPEFQDVADYLQETLALPGGAQTLRPIQVAALQAIHDVGGLVGAIAVGEGKTLISFLAGVVLDVKRVLLLIPAKLREKTRRDFDELRRHWRAPAQIEIMSYELLSRDRGVAELDEYRPDLVISDEAHRLKSPRAACTKRLHRYLRKNPQARYLDMSGTSLKRSLMECHHRINWAIPDGLQPLPRKYPEAAEWSRALDEGVDPLRRLLPGALLWFCDDDELLELGRRPPPERVTQIARQAYQRRLFASPGIVGSVGQFDGAMSLVIRECPYVPGEATREAFSLLRETWETPGGEQIDSPAMLWAKARQLAQGFYYRYNPPPCREWADARREWASVAREVQSRYPDIDTPMIAARNIDRGRVPFGSRRLARWRAIKPTYEPSSEPVWIDDACIESIAANLDREPVLIWVHETAMGERLSRVLGLPYYAGRGRCGSKMIEDEKGTCILSIASNCEGRNLQDRYSRNLVVSPPPGGNVWEQLLGRTHRSGQEADEVDVIVFLICYEQWSAFRQAQRDARYIEDMTMQKQKLNFADVVIPSEQDIAQRCAQGSPLWSAENVKFFEKGVDKK